METKKKKSIGLVKTCLLVFPTILRENLNKCNGHCSTLFKVTWEVAEERP